MSKKWRRSFVGVLRGQNKGQLGKRKCAGMELGRGGGTHRELQEPELMPARRALGLGRHALWQKGAAAGCGKSFIGRELGRRYEPEFDSNRGSWRRVFDSVRVRFELAPVVRVLQRGEGRWQAGQECGEG